jgi:hypothetical protein
VTENVAKEKRMKSKRNKQIRNLIIFSDTHIGCRHGLMAPEGATLDEGGKAMPSRIQLKMWAFWRQFWDEWVPRVTHGEPFAVVHNGDAIDGVHHGSTTQWSQSLADQRNHAEHILKPVVDACDGRYYHIRGTEAHVGKSATEEEQLAKSLGAIPNEDGQYARWEMWKDIAGKGLIHFSHHIGTTSSAAHETSALNAEIASCFNEAGRWGHAPPAIVVRSHRHRCSEVRLPAAWGYATVFVTPAWQLKTPFVYRIPGGRNSTPQIGGSLIRFGGEELHTRHFVVDIGRSAVE